MQALVLWISNQNQRFSKIFNRGSLIFSILERILIKKLKIFAHYEIQFLKQALKKVVAQDLQAGEEYQINHGILAMMEQGAIFKPGAVDTWMDCGNPEVTLQTNTEMLEIKQKAGEELQDPSAEITNSTIVPPCFIAENVKISDSTIGPGVSIGAGTQIHNCQLQNCLIQSDSNLENLNLQKAMIGNQVRYKGNPTFVSLGDYSQLE